MLIEEVNQRLLFDRLCARWTTERAAVDLYGHVIRLGQEEGVGEEIVERLAAFQGQEEDHAASLADVCRRFGWDPDAPTVSAETARREMDALIDICASPGATFDRGLQCLLDAELIDTAGWEMLEELCKQATVDEDVVREFRRAWRQEKEHLHYLKTHVMERARRELKVEAYEWENPPV